MDEPSPSDSPSTDRRIEAPSYRSTPLMHKRRKLGFLWDFGFFRREKREVFSFEVLFCFIFFFISNSPLSGFLIRANMRHGNRTSRFYWALEIQIGPSFQCEMKCELRPKLIFLFKPTLQVNVVFAFFLLVNSYVCYLRMVQLNFDLKRNL